MPKRIDPQIRTLIERYGSRGWTAAHMQRQLLIAKEARGLKADIPSIRTISDILAAQKDSPAADRYKVTEAAWPDSFDDELGFLPWAASASYFELLGQLGGRRPLIPLARWFWRVTEAAPDAPLWQRWQTAGDLAIWECLPVPDVQKPNIRAIELYLMIKSWRGGDEEQRFNELPPDMQYTPGAGNWSLKSNVPGQLEALQWYATELLMGVFTLDARDRFSGYMKAADKGSNNGQG